jgi:hypothetical protein
LILYDFYCKKYELNHFLFPSHVNTIVGAVGGGAASRYVSGSDQMMWLLAAGSFKLVVYLQSVGIESGKSVGRVGREWVENG